MQFKNIIFTLAAVAVSVEAAKYSNCKCHDHNTGLQVDWATEKACNEYKTDIPAKVRYSADDHHSCIPDTVAYLDGDNINNKLWNLKCYRQGDSFYQYCWGKSKRDDAAEA